MMTRSPSLKFIASMALVAMTCIGLAGCGGGGGGGGSRSGGGSGDQMTIEPPTELPPDHSDTPAGAAAIALGESFQGRTDSPNDVDYFRLRVDAPGMLTIRTTGNADPDIAVFDGGGIEVPRVSGNWIGNITQEILDRGSDLIVRFSGGNAGQEYTGSATLDQLVQDYPELEVGTPAVSDASPVTGASFTLSATVSNTGDGASVATTLRFYRSTDATITTSDTEVGTAAVAELAPSGSGSGSVDLTAPSSPGTYYYGACVDAVTDESDTTNNCSASVLVTVQGTQPPEQDTQPPEQGNPDLDFLAVAVGHGPSEEGYSVRFAIVIANVGDGASAASTLRYFRSTDATITTSDTLVGTDAVPGLAASPSDSSRHTLDVKPSSPGTYYYGACVDAVGGRVRHVEQLFEGDAGRCTGAVGAPRGGQPRPDYRRTNTLP